MASRTLVLLDVPKRKESIHNTEAAERARERSRKAAEVEAEVSLSHSFHGDILHLKLDVETAELFFFTILIEKKVAR